MIQNIMVETKERNMFTTLKEIKRHDPCKPSWKKLLASIGKTRADDEPLSYKYILDTLGIEDAIWALVTHQDPGLVRRFACDCAEHVLHLYEAEYPDDNRPRHAIEVARRYVEGKATDEELEAAGDAAQAASRDAGEAAWAAEAASWAVAGDAEGDAALAAARAAWAAEAAAWASAQAASRDARGCRWAASWAASARSWDAECEWQDQRFREMFCVGNSERKRNDQ